MAADHASVPPELPGAADLDRAAQRLAEGGLVAFPTETVYGLGGDALNAQAIARIYAAKGRPSNHPVIVHVAPQADLSFWADSLPGPAQRLIDAFWPGPLTLILPRADRVPLSVTGGQDSVGLRCPSHPVAQALLSAFATRMPGGHGGVAAPSANKFGRVSPTQAAHVRAEFPELGEDRLLVLEGGASQVGIESTILDLSRIPQGGRPALLRPGHVSASQIADVIGELPALPDTDAPRVSGSLKAHYAPQTPVTIASRAALQRLPALADGATVALVVFQPITALPDGYVQIVAPDDPARYARDLYAMLRELDRGGHARILLEAPPDHAAWLAVQDRIGRAAAAFAPDVLNN